VAIYIIVISQKRNSSYLSVSQFSNCNRVYKFIEYWKHNENVAKIMHRFHMASYIIVLKCDKDDSVPCSLNITA